jgi:hypothetical protein
MLGFEPKASPFFADGELGGVDQQMSDRGLAAILAFIAVWRQDRMAARPFAPTPPGRPLPLR